LGAAPKIVILSAIVSIAIALSTNSAYATAFFYNDFSNITGLTLVGNPAAPTTPTTGDGTVLRLTPASPGQAGAAYSTSAVTLGPSDTFSTQFHFRFTNPGGIDPADGITFVIAASFHDCTPLARLAYPAPLRSQSQVLFFGQFAPATRPNFFAAHPILRIGFHCGSWSCGKGRFPTAGVISSETESCLGTAAYPLSLDSGAVWPS
jgi:hypothetical protein